MPVPEYMTYEEFGRRFFELAVTESRVGDAFAAIAGEAFDVGPIPSGPGGMVKVRARVNIDEPNIERAVEDLIRFTVQIPLRIKIDIDLKLDRLRYDVDGLVTLPLTVHAVEPLEIHFDVAAPKPADVHVDVASRNMRAEIVRNLAQVDDEVRRVIARQVAEEIDKPEIRAARIIDVDAQLAAAMDPKTDDDAAATAEPVEADEAE
ncbi:hypothetical protein [Gordonia crocea]|uniref:Uncharacterized protein n=1 Tax=Gordonia crocea TaxID=589162 RepID=A0A7I9UX68_9ACTN|nr:hypothetical protein [Gordonia crocea]GED97804.1 hypothetical protein nbrc107697_18430 [Gordonia crocea]